MTSYFSKAVTKGASAEAKKRWLPCGQNNFGAKGYPGLVRMSPQLSCEFPRLEGCVYVEPFCGMSRTAHFVSGPPNAAKSLHLNDLNEVCLRNARELFPKARVTKLDFKDILSFYKDKPDAFLMMDPPWHKFDLYVITQKTKSYYDDIFALLKDAKCKWLLCGPADPKQTAGRALIKSGYENHVLFHPRARICGGRVGVRFVRNF
jgi:hypothetical protein